MKKLQFVYATTLGLFCATTALASCPPYIDYDNGNHFLVGDLWKTAYYRSGNVLYDAIRNAVYYHNGQMFQHSQNYFSYPNGNDLSLGGYVHRYPDGQDLYLFDGGKHNFYYANGQILKSDTDFYYKDGSVARAGGVLYLPDGSVTNGPIHLHEDIGSYGSLDFDITSTTDKRRLVMSFALSNEVRADLHSDYRDFWTTLEVRTGAPGEVYQLFPRFSDHLGCWRVP